MGDADDTLFEERTRTLSDVEPSLQPGETIRQRTLHAVGGAAPAEREHEPEPARARRSHGSVRLHELPRISIGPTPDARHAERGLQAPPRADAEYAVLATLGEGGMGRVHLAHQRSLGRDVAVKTLKDDAPRAVARALLREARLTGSLEHPGVIPVHALGVDDAGRPILVMKRVDGIELAALLANPSHAAWSSRAAAGDRLSAALEILVHVCLTVEFAHSRGVLHRDIKPENVMVGGFGEVYVLDWGIASARDEQGEDEDETGEDEPLVGTPAYMPPEMVLGGEMDERTDVYLLGATLHEIVTGRPRHDGATVRSVLRSALASAPFAYGPQVPEALASLCNRATARDRAERPARVSAFREEIVRFQLRRSTQVLCDAALERLARLEELLASAPETTGSDGRAPERGAPTDLPLAYRLAAEARFGLTQGMQSGGGEIASDGMQRCLAALVDLELRQGHADSAEALLREMDEPPAPLSRRVASVRERDAARERERTRLETFARDFDPSALAPKRTRLILGACLITATVWVAVAIGGNTPTLGWLLVVSLAGNLAVCGILVALRRRGGNKFNRSIGGLLALAFAGSLANRAWAYFVGGATPIHTLAVDLVIFTMTAAASAIVLFRGMWFVAIVFACGLITVRLWPEEGARMFAFTIVAALLTGAMVLARASKPGSAD